MKEPKLDHELRSKGIGGSEIAAVAGLSPWAGPLDVWKRKVGLDKADLDSTDIRRGRHLEAGLRDWYCQQEERVVVPYATTQHKEHPIVIATPDGVSAPAADGTNADTVLEIKAPRRTSDSWGIAGTDQIPKYYYPQVIWEMAVTGLPTAHVAALIWGELKVYHVPWNQALFDALLELAEKFWQDHVLANEPPPPDASKGYTQYLADRWGAHSEVILPATPELDELAHDLRDIEAMEARVKERKTMAQNKIKAVIGDAAGAEGPWGKITWRRTKDVSKVDWRQAAERAGASEEDIQASTTSKPGSRRFLTSWAK